MNIKTLLLLAIGLCTLISVFSVSSACDTCANDEICNSTINACICNSSTPINTANYPSPTVDCNGGKMSLFISKCWLENNGYKSSNISLNNATCLAVREIVNGTAYMTLHKALASNVCGNNVNINGTYVTYSNRLYIFAEDTPVLTKNDVIINVSCVYPLFMTTQLNFTIKPIIGSTVLNISGANANLTVNMMVYTDSSFTRLLSQDDTLYVEDTVYIAVQIPNLDVDTFKLKVLNIIASASQSGPSYYLLQNGCPSIDEASGLMNVLLNGNASESRFAMKVFQISGATSVLLSAELTLCSSDCDSKCNANSKSTGTQGDTAIVQISINAEDRFLFDSANCLSWKIASILLSLLLVKMM